MSEPRLIRLEAITDRQESDLNRITSSMEKLVSQGEKTNLLLQEALVRDERFDAKIEKIDTNLSAKILSNNDAIKRSHDRADKIEAIISRLAWTVISVVIMGVIGAVLKFGAQG